MRSEELDMECKIHRLEDKLLRSKNFDEQMELRSVLTTYRKQLQSLQWKKSRDRV